MKLLTAETVPPKRGKQLLSLVREFADRLPKLQTQRGAYNKCKFVSYELVLYLRRRGFNARLIHIQGCPAPTYPNPHSVWAKKRRDKWSHYVVGVGHWSIDLTARQFDSELPVPLIKSLASLREQWTLVEDDRFLNGFINEMIESRITR